MDSFLVPQDTAKSRKQEEKNNEIMARALIEGGSEVQKDYWLPRIAEGRPLCGIAITEPDYGSDVASMKLKATPTEGGWLLNGAKVKAENI